MSKFLNIAHSAISGTLIVFTFGGFALFGQQFWSLVQHLKALPPPPKVDSAAPAKLA